MPLQGLQRPLRGEIFHCKESDLAPEVRHALLIAKYYSQELICARDSYRLLAGHKIKILGFKDVM